MPLAFGPEITSPWPALSSMSLGTAATPSSTSSGWRRRVSRSSLPAAELGDHAAAGRDRAARPRGAGRCASSASAAARRLGRLVAHALGERGQHALLLALELGLGDLEPVAVREHRARLDEHARAALARAVHDAGHALVRVAPHRQHVAPVAQRVVLVREHVGEALDQLAQAADDALAQVRDLGAQRRAAPGSRGPQSVPSGSSASAQLRPRASSSAGSVAHAANSAGQLRALAGQERCAAPRAFCSVDQHVGERARLQRAVALEPREVRIDVAQIVERHAARRARAAPSPRRSRAAAARRARGRARRSDRAARGLAAAARAHGARESLATRGASTALSNHAPFMRTQNFCVGRRVGLPVASRARGAALACARAAARRPFVRASAQPPRATGVGCELDHARASRPARGRPCCES